MINSPASVVPGEWSHFSAVYTDEETRICFNRRLVSTGPGSAEGVPSKFVVGNVGVTNLLYFDRGQIRSVRISKVERYSGDQLKLSSELVGDESTLLLISEPWLEGDLLRTAEGTVVGRVEKVTTNAR